MTAFQSYSGWAGFDLNSRRTGRIEQVEHCPMCGLHLHVSLRSPDEYPMQFHGRASGGRHVRSVAASAL
jgi:hypothetical protein